MACLRAPHILCTSLGHYRRQRNSLQLAPPPGTGLMKRISISEVIFINDRPNVSRRGVRKGVVRKQSQNLRRTLQQPDAEIDEPGVFAIVAQGGEPHLPVQPGLMWRNE